MNVLNNNLNKSILDFLSKKESRVKNGFLTGGATPFFPNSLVEWLILFLVLIILVLVVRQLYMLFEEKKHERMQKKETSHNTELEQEWIDGEQKHPYNIGFVGSQTNKELLEDTLSNTSTEDDSPITFQGKFKNNEDGSWEACLYGDRFPENEKVFNKQEAVGEKQDEGEKEEHQVNEKGDEWEMLHQDGGSEEKTKNAREKENPPLHILEEKDETHFPNYSQKEMEELAQHFDQGSGKGGAKFPQLIPAMTPWGLMYVPVITPKDPLEPKQDLSETSTDLQKPTDADEK